MDKWGTCEISWCLWAFWGALGSVLGHLVRVLGRLGRLLGVSWGGPEGVQGRDS